MGNNTTSVKVQPLRQNGMSIKTPEQLLLEDFDRKQNNSGDVGQSEPELGQGFAYGGQEGYRALLDKIVNREGFSYDHEKDPVWSAYAKAYRREGDRAVEDTLAATSKATGGVPSSYAVTAASQAGDYYAAQLADKVPELEQNAYQRYLQGIDLDYQALAALQTDRSFDYNKYLQEQDRQLQEQQMQQSQQQADRNWQQYEQQLGTQQEQTDYERRQQEYANALALYQILGYMTPEIAKILGVKGDTATAPVQQMGDQIGNPTGNPTGDQTGSQTGDQTGNPTGDQDGTESYEDRGDSVPEQTRREVLGMFPDGRINDEGLWRELVQIYGEDAVTKAGFSYQEPGWTDEVKRSLLEKYPGFQVSSPEEWRELTQLYGEDVMLENGFFFGSDFDGVTREEAMAYMREHKVPDSEIGKVMGRETWERMKEDNAPDGYVRGNSNYEDYLWSWVTDMVLKYGK